jgi:hypothetical protein
MSNSLYQQVMGSAFAQLPVVLQRFHSLDGSHTLYGSVEVEPPESFGARWIARGLGAPLEAQKGPIRFELVADAASEIWTRHFPGKTMTSRLTVVHGQIAERLGAARLGFELEGGADKLEMRLVWLRFLGLPCPRWLLPSIIAEEAATEGRLHFRVRASLPLLGVVTGYWGYLELEELGRRQI